MQGTRHKVSGPLTRDVGQYKGKEMKKYIALLVIIVTGLCYAAYAEDASPTKNAVSPYVDTIFNAIRNGDKDALYSLTEQAQDELAEIKASKPEFLREKKQQEHRALWQANFENSRGSTPDQYQALAQLLELNPAVEIMEVVPNAQGILDIYLRLQFKSVELSPLLASDGRAKFLKERTIRLMLSKTGLYINYAPVYEVPDVYWSNLPLQIVVAKVYGPPAYFNITFMVVGDAPIKGGAVSIGGLRLRDNLFSISVEEQTMKVKFDTIYSDVPSVQSRDTPVMVEITDSAGNTAKAALILPPFTQEQESMFRQHTYVREPWHGMNMWKNMNGIKLLQ